MIAGAYSMHLYCRFAQSGDQAIAKPHEYDARHADEPFEPNNVQTAAQARRVARRKGWRFDKDGDVTCPACVKHGPGVT